MKKRKGFLTFLFFFFLLLLSYQSFLGASYASIGIQVDSTTMIDGQAITFKKTLPLEIEKQMVIESNDASYDLEIDVKKEFNLLSFDKEKESYDITINVKDRTSNKLISSSKISTNLNQEAVIEKGNNTISPSYDLKVSLKLEESNADNSFK